MSDPYASEGIVGFLASRGLRFWAVVAAGLLLLVVVLVTWARFGLVRVHYTAGDQVDPDRIEARAYDIETGEVSDGDAFMTIFGVALVPRSTRYVQVTSGRAETVVPIGDVPRFGFGRFDAALEAQRTVDKLGTGLAGCVFGNASGSYNYECLNAHAILRYQRPDTGSWKNESVQTLFPNQTTKLRPYADGLIGLVADTGARTSARLFYVVPGRAPVTLPVPPDLVRGGTAYLNIATDTTDRSNRTFMLYDVFSGRVVRYSGFGADARTSEFARSRPYNPTSDVTLCALRSETVYCYTGLRGNAPDSHEEDVARAKAGPAAVEVFGSGDTAGPFVAPSVFGLEKFVVTADELYVQISGRLYEIDLEGGALRLTQISPAVSAVAAGEDLYWNTVNGIYRYDPATRAARLVFSAANLNLSDMSVRGGQLNFNAFVRDDQQSQLHTYRLGDEPLHGSRWEDKLPYSTRRELPILAMDYTADRMYIQLRAGTETTADGQVIVDQESFDSARDAVLKALAADGFDTEKLDIQFTS